MSVTSDSDGEGPDCLQHGEYSPRKACYGHQAVRAKLTARPQEGFGLCGHHQRQVKPEDPIIVKHGLLQLGAAERRQRDGLLYVPNDYDGSKPVPVALLLHGAGGNVQQSISLLKHEADSESIILVAPESRGRTWDIILHTYGPDVAFIDKTMEIVFQRFCVDQSHLAIGGFSDGASYALSLGIPNGELFSHILAFSPGFMRPPSYQDSPEVYISHGTKDAVLNISHCSRRLVPRLKASGFAVQYREFEGGHSVPDAISHEAVNWFLRTAGHTAARARE